MNLANRLDYGRDVPARGYCWWYVDALSDDGQHGITLIAFLGSVFSPWYAWARRGGGGDPLDHCALNVALYGPRRRWALTERRRRDVERGPDFLRLGPSSLRWDGSTLVVDIAEFGAPLPRRIRGTVRLHTESLGQQVFTLDAAGRHHWSPLAPCARAEVALESPALRWSGPAYFDTNAGSAPLEDDFVTWDWCRAPLPGETAVLYNAQRRDGTAQSLALRIAAKDGAVEEFPPPPPAALPRTRWRLPRPTRADAPPRVLQTLEDAPFYSRSVIETRLLGQTAVAVHESLSLNRFRQPIVQAMLPFKVPRRF